MTLSLLTRRSALSGVLALAMSSGALAASNFYEGKTMTLIVGFAPGGGVDLAGRAIGRHLPRFLPGNPNVVVQNMPGASGLLAANHIAQRAPRDGLTIGVPGRSWHIEAIIGNSGAHFDPTKLSYIGSTGVVNSMAWVRRDTGLRNFEDMRSAKEAVVVGSLGPGSPTSTVPILFAAAGVPLKVVTGYRSTSDMVLALERGEIQSVFTTADSFARRQDLVENKTVVPILQTKPELDGVPLAREQLPEKHRALFDLARSGDSLGLMLVAPPEIPQDRLTALRDAFLKMSADPQYQEELSKVDSSRSTPLSGKEVADAVADLKSSTTADVIAGFEKLKKGAL